jgi:hypothetical protein
MKSVKKKIFYFILWLCFTILLIDIYLYFQKLQIEKQIIQIQETIKNITDHG